MNADRRRQCLLAAAAWLASPLHAATGNSAAATPATMLPMPAPLARLQAGAAGALLGVTRTGEAWLNDGKAWQKLGSGLDPATPLASGHGRVVGRSADGRLWVWEAGRTSLADGPRLAPHAGLLVLAFGIIGVTEATDGQHRAVRFDPAGRVWVEAARSTLAVLPDARPVQFDPDGRGGGAGADDNGHVAIFGAPSSTRYRHGVLGDAIEPTAMLLLERHGLQAMAQLALPAPHVFEDIAPRPIAWRGQRALLTMRSGPLGGQLCVVARSATAARDLEILALGEPMGMANRWLSASTDGQRLLAVHTPHLSGVLHRYTAQGDRLASQVLGRGLGNHALGDRELDVSAWLGARWVVRTLDRQQLRIFDIDAALVDTAPETIKLPGEVMALQPWRRDAETGVAALLHDGSVWWLRVSG